MNFINVFQHCIKGQIKKGKVSGVHYYDSDTMKILKINKLDESSGVWEAEIEIFDKKTNKWIKKDSTTFFPKDWSMHQLFHECVYAVKNMKKKVNSKNIFTSLTETGVKVEIISVNNEMKSIYPILD